jgi:hypothetical protein
MLGQAPIESLRPDVTILMLRNYADNQRSRWPVAEAMVTSTFSPVVTSVMRYPVRLSRSAAPSSSLRARATRDRIVPTGHPHTLAASA